MSAVRIVIVGAGTMGTAIADTFARAGLPTALMSRNPSQLSGLHENIQAISAFPETSPDLIVEAIPEDIDLKIDLLLGAEAAYGGKPILASNSSGLPLQEIADRLDFPDRFLGIHYFHPARELPLVEIVRIAETSENALGDARRMLSMSGRDSVVMHRPMPGALINRLQHAMLHEAYYMMSQGLATAEDIDKAARGLLGPRMCISGLLEQKDIGGLEGHARAQQTIVPDLCHDARPNSLVQDMLARGDVGLKSGKGFYDWSGTDAHSVAERSSERLRTLIAYLEENR